MLQSSIKALLHYSTDVKKRNFTETVEIHFGLKNFDPARDRRIAGNTQLPHPPRLKFRCCVFGNEAHIDEAKQCKLDYKSLDDLKKINKDKKIVKKIGMILLLLSFNHYCLCFWVFLVFYVMTLSHVYCVCSHPCTIFCFFCFVSVWQTTFSVLHV